MKKILLPAIMMLVSITATSQNPFMLKDVYAGPTGSGIQQIVKTGNYTFFNALDGSSPDRGLYRTDGTAGGTIKLNLTYPTYISTKAEKLTPLGDKVVFAGDNFPNYGEIWASDGTQAGTVAIERFQPSSPNVFPIKELSAMGSYVYYSAVNNSNQAILKRTDGTVAGTSEIYNFGAYTGIAEVVFLTAVNNVMYFIVYDRYGTGIDQLWRSDGTTAGTYLVYDFGLNQYVASYIMPAGNNLYIMTVVPGIGNVLWKSDGTAAGSMNVKTISSSGNNNYPQFAAIGNTLYFSGLDGNGKELWKTDGTAAGTVMVSDINPGAASSNPANLSVLNNQLYFSATTTAEGNELWKYDGATASLIKDINPGSASSSIGSISVSNNTIVFRATTAVAGSELWITDGTIANTQQVADINPGSLSSVPNFLTAGNPVYFSANNGINGGEIFKYDNTEGINGLHKIYVNDNSTSGDIFTTAVGNNSNSGVKTAPVATINYAISIAQAGDTIVVDAGTYVENVVVNKSVTIRGVKYGQDPAYSNNRGNETILYSAIAFTGFSNAIVAPAAANITLDGLLIDGDNPGITSNVNYNGADVDAGVAIYSNSILASNLVVKNCIVKNCSQYGVGMFRNFGNNTGTATTNVLYTNNHADNIGSRAFVFGYDVYGSILNNTVTRCFNGVWVSQQLLANINLPVLVDGNKIEAYLLGCQSSGNQASTQAITYSNNEINQADVQTWVAPNANSNTLLTAFSFITNNNRPVNCMNNIISGVGTGVLINNAGSAIPIVVQQNSLTTVSGRYIDGTSSVPANATCNWYGTTDAETIASKITGNVNYTPWLINGTDTDPATGFQPVGNTCLGQPKYYVNDNSLTGDVFTTAVGSNSNNGSASSPFATPDYAYSIAQPGDTIYVDAGTYDLGGFTYSFPKPMVFLGTNYLVSPNDPADKLLLNAARNAESIFTNGKMSIASSGISIEGFTWDVGNRTGVELVNTAATNNDFGNFKFTKNIFKITHTNANLNSFSITGKSVSSPNLPVTTDYTIADNRFEKSGSATGNTLNLNYLKNISVNNNTFLVTGSTLRTQQVLNLGSTGLVSELTFSNNSIEDASTVAGGNRIASALIAGNKMHNINSPLTNSNPMPESSSIEFSNNIVGNDLGTPFMLYTRSGTSLAGTSNLLKLENNIITGFSTATDNQLFATTIFTINNSVLNPSVIIRSNKFTYSGDFSTQDPHFFRPITVRGNVGNTTIENNEVVLNNTGGMAPFNPSTNLPENPAVTIGTDNGTGAYMTASAVVNILNNKIHGFKNSVAFYDVSNNPRDPYNGYGNIPVGAVVNLNNNSFTGDVMSINNGTVGQTVNATCNWYGTAAAQAVITKVSASTVNYTPWLSNGTDNYIATGFQPVPGSCTGTPVTAVLTQVNNVTCFGAANGSINVTISGGVTPYTFAWSKDAVAGYSSLEDLTNLSPGVYDLLVTDANGSTATLSATITQPTLIVPVITDHSTACSNIASVTASGGVAPYSFVWSNNVTGSTISNVPAGTYTVTVTDATNCSVTASITLVARPAFNPSVQTTDVSCFGGSNGLLTVTNVNGTAPYQYSINGINYQASNIFNNLAAGTYTVYVIDANNCSGFTTKTINQPSAIVITVDNIQGTCFGANTGSISISNSGGSPGYSYSWTGPGGFTATSKNISNLAAGSYSLTVTDSKGCTASVLNVMVSSTNEITVNAVVVNIACKGETNGSITLNVLGGSGSGFTYAWSNAATTSVINNLLAGNYNVTITDIGSGCSLTRSYSITQPTSAVGLSTSKTNATGCASMGTITATGSGGTGAYMYRLNSGTYQSSGLFTNLGEGNYTVWVKDANGCTKTAAVGITDNGSDEYESNNSKNQAKNITIGNIINARIAVSTDIDWFKFTTPAGTNTYTLGLTHPNASFVFNLYLTGNNVPALVPVSTTATTKVYVLTGGTTYYIQVSGGTSYTCYNLTVSPLTTFTQPITSTEKEQVKNQNTTISKLGDLAKEVANLSASAFPNPHQGSFKIQIASPETGIARIELFTITGQKLQEKNVAVQKSVNNIILFNVIQHGTIFYRVVVGKNTVTGKVIGIE